MTTDDVGLNWSDRTDQHNATRGRIDKLEPCVIRDESGRVIWDNDRWSFLDSDEYPDKVHPSLWRQSGLNSTQGLFEVAAGIYQIRGFDISNMTIVEGDTGVVVVDPLVSKECAAAGLELYRRNRGERPVKAVIYSHSHLDHFGGVCGVTSPEDIDAGRVEIIAPDGFAEHAVSENVFAGPAMGYRGLYMFGKSLPAGPEGSVGAGLGQDISSGTANLVPPTTTVTATDQELWLGGVRFVFQLTPDTEAPSEMNFYLPENRVLLIAENVNHTLHNVLTLRGSLVRDAHSWAAYITESLRLFDDAEVLIGSHNWPTWGRAEVARMLTEQRDAYAYLHDQTVRLMNRGLTGPEIAEEITEFPGELGKAWNVRGYYGSISHNVKAVYQRYMGWFDGNPANLWQHPPVERAKRYVACMGGADRVVEMARESFAQGDLRWVGEILNHVLFAHPEHGQALELQAQTFEQLGYAQENATWRNFYLTGARELRNSSETAPGGQSRVRSKQLLTGLTTEQIFQSMAVRLDGPRAAPYRLLLRWEFTDSGEAWTLLVANGVLTPMRGDPPAAEEPHVTLRLRREVLDSILTRDSFFTEAIDSGAIELAGDATVLDTFHDFLEEPQGQFPIALP